MNEHNLNVPITNFACLSSLTDRKYIFFCQANAEIFKLSGDLKLSLPFYKVFSMFCSLHVQICDNF